MTLGHTLATLWLWLSEPMAAAFGARAFDLAQESRAEEVACRFTPWGQKIISIVFDG